MRVLRRPMLRLERLEARDCPTVSISLIAGNLTISGRPTGDLLLKAINNNQIQVQDGTKLLGTYNVPGNVTVQLSSRPGAVNFDVNGKTVNGNVLFNLGNGYTGTGINPEDRSVNIYDGTVTTALGNGTIRGNVTIQAGDGRELVGVGYIHKTVAVDQPLTIRGNLTVVGRASLPSDENFQLGEGSEVRGSVSVTHYDNVSLGSQINTITSITTVRGDVTITTAGVGGGLFANLYGVFQQNVTVNGAASSSTSNSFTLAPPENTVNSVISGNLNVTFASALNGNLFNILGSAGTAVSQIFGTTTLTSNNGALGGDDALLNGQFAKLVTVNLGDGDNKLTVAPAAQFNGDFVYTAAPTTGNGDNDLEFKGLYLGKLIINLGNGDNTVDINAQVNNTIELKAGNGNNTVTLDSTNNIFNIDFLFGNGVDKVTLTTGDTITGKIDFGGSVDIYVPNLANTLGLTLLNLP